MTAGADDPRLQRASAYLAGVLSRASRLAVVTGAGVSAASGVPTFRGAGGLWRTYRAEELATPQAFDRDPRLVWEWYDWRRQHLAACRPNAAHEVLARWQGRWPELALVTQNVDDLHERAGARDVLHLHGSIWDVRCARGCARGRAAVRDDRVPMVPLPPPCPGCGGLLRPGVVWFGEALDATTIDRAAAAVAASDVVLVVGTSAVVHPAAALIPDAGAGRQFVVEVNPDETPLSARVNVQVRLPAEVALPAIEAALAR